MHFPRHWTLARKGGVAAWGWSDESLEAAKADGLARVDRIIEWLRNDLVGERGPYGYPDRPMREQVLQEFRNSSGELTGAVSRNSYGCLVLNTANLLFVDIDESDGGFLGGLRTLFGGSDFQGRVIRDIKNWMASRPEWGWRVYRTRAGIRLMATHQPISPEDADCKEAFSTFRADRLYQKLCVNQKCFRARITPKPWRCGVDKPNVRWPWRDPEAEETFRNWDQRYLSSSKDYAVYHLLGVFGAQEPHPELKELITFHDKFCRVETGLKLA
jgi:hypothetical protein